MVARPGRDLGLRPVDCIFMMGSSIVCGGRTTKAQRPANLAVQLRDQFIWNTDARVIQPYEAGVNSAQARDYWVPGDGTTTETWGPEAEMLRRRTAQTHVFKICHGSAYFGSSPSADYNLTKGVAGGLYTRMLDEHAAFKAALARRGLRPNWIGALIDAGAHITTDTDLTEANAWTSKATQYIADLRADVLGPACPIVLQYVIPTFSAKTYYANVRTQQRALSISGVTLISLDGAVADTDAVHADAASNVQFGRDALEVFQGYWVPQIDFTNTYLFEGWGWDARNTVASSRFTELRDLSGNGRHFRNDTDSNYRPDAVTFPNGERAMGFFGYDVGDSSTLGVGERLLRNGSDFLFASSTGFSVGMIAALDQDNLYGGLPMNALVIQGSGNPYHIPIRSTDYNVQTASFFSRNDALTSNLVDGTMGVNLWDGQVHAYVVTDSKTSVQATLDGSAGSARSYTRTGAQTLTSTAIGGLDTPGNTSDDRAALPAKGKLLGWIAIAGVADSTWKANFRAYAQRRGGTP